jgi:EF-P beta-lysylation protein EpmB
VLPERIPTTTPTEWQSELRDAITSADELLQFLGLSAEEAGFSEEACADFPAKVPRVFAARMKKGDPRDPLLFQVMASGRELLPAPGYGPDPVGESGTANPVPGIIHKYHGRALLITTGSCAVHCRYCFRRHFPYDAQQNSRREWREALGYVARDPDISEVILSGGDPLVLTDRHLHDLVSLIADIPHVRRLRIHSRLPVVIPARVTNGLLDSILCDHLQTVMVIHSNHANEIDAEVRNAMAAMRERGITLLNQAVLLKEVNDDPDTLVALSERLFAAGVMPYYLHLLDKVFGAAHFDVPEQRARQLLSELAARLPGYLVPKLVREVAGAPSKTTLAPL